MKRKLEEVNQMKRLADKLLADVRAIEIPPPFFQYAWREFKKDVRCFFQQVGWR